jgi:hypothetical protein
MSYEVLCCMTLIGPLRMTPRCTKKITSHWGSVSFPGLLTARVGNIRGGKTVESFFKVHRVYTDVWLILGRMDRMQFHCWHGRNWNGNSNRKEDVVEQLPPWRRVYAGRTTVMVPELRILLCLLLFLALTGKWTTLFCLCHAPLHQTNQRQFRRKHCQYPKVAIACHPFPS